MNSQTKLIISCPQHGEFKQIPAAHLHETGCPICKSSKGELKIQQLLEEYKIKYIHQKKFSDCRNKKELPFDFYLPDANLCIEYQGEQHYKPMRYFGGKEKFKSTTLNDSIKKEYCELKSIKLLMIRYDEDIEVVLKKSLTLA